MKEILKALERKEKIMRHGKQKSIIIPTTKTKAKQLQVREHPFFGMLSRDTDVSKSMTKLRRGR